jgi:hypothetical protein
MNLKRRHKSFMNKPKMGINAPGQVSFQSDGIMDGLADGFRDGLADGFRDGLLDGLLDGLVDGLVDGLLDGSGDSAATGQAAATSAAVIGPGAMQQQKRRTPALEASQDDVPLAA